MDQITKIKNEVRAKEWQKIISECQLSGMTVSGWCKVNRVNTNSYYYWLRKLREKTISELPAEMKNSLATVNDEPVTFKKLDVIPPVSGMQAAVIVHIKGADIEVANGAARETVEAVLLALKSVC